jgi:hypothetical protein
MVALALDAANLSLAFRGHNNDDDDEADAGSKQRLDKGEVRDERATAREVTRSDRWGDLFPACFLLLHVVRTYIQQYLFPPLGSSGQHCGLRKGGECVVAGMADCCRGRAPRPSD